MSISCLSSYGIDINNKVLSGYKLESVKLNSLDIKEKGRIEGDLDIYKNLEVGGLSKFKDKVELSESLNMDGNRIINLDNPLNSGDAVNKSYVDSKVGAGIDINDDYTFKSLSLNSSDGKGMNKLNVNGNTRLNGKVDILGDLEIGNRGVLKSSKIKVNDNEIYNENESLNVKGKKSIVLNVEGEKLKVYDDEIVCLSRMSINNNLIVGGNIEVMGDVRLNGYLNNIKTKQAIKGLYTIEEDEDLITKKYMVDSIEELNNKYVKVNDGYFNGDLDMKKHKIVGVGEPEDEGDCVNKYYFDKKYNKLIEGKILFDKIKSIGKIQCEEEPEEDNDLINKKYITREIETLNNKINKKVSRVGDVFNGNIDMGGNKIYNVKEPEDEGDLISKKYLEYSLNLNNSIIKLFKGFKSIGTNEINFNKNTIELNNLREGKYSISGSVNFMSNWDTMISFELEVFKKESNDTYRLITAPVNHWVDSMDNGEEVINPRNLIFDFHKIYSVNSEDIVYIKIKPYPETYINKSYVKFDVKICLTKIYE